MNGSHRKHVIELAIAVVVVGTMTVALAWLGWAWYESRLPATYSVMDYAIPDDGGKPLPEPMSGHAMPGMSHDTSIAQLHGPAGTPQRRFTLTAEQGPVKLASGRVVQALSFDGTLPGPELRVHQGDLVEVTLRNRNVAGGVTIHWHGVDVPNAEDGVAGVTQNAVFPGATYVYRFRAEQVGTFWYHTHQSSSAEVRRGLYGALVIEPASAGAPASGRGADMVAAIHTLGTTQLVNATDGVERHAVEAGTPVRLRLINTDSVPHSLDLAGTPFRVLAIDGTDLNGPTELEGKTLVLAAGGRYDLGFTMPARPVKLAVEGAGTGVALSGDGRANPPPPTPGTVFDPASYGRPAPTPFDASSHFDRSFALKLTRKPGFFDGRPGMQWALNGGIFPRVPMFMVEKGDLVHVTIENSTGAVHPMHLHGHHMLVLSRNGKPVSGSPWWSDTLEVEAD